MNRRHFLKRWLRALAAAGTTAVTGVVPLFRTAAARNDTLDVGTLDAVADTMVPRDEAPGAVDVGVVAMLAPKIERDLRLRKVYVSGLAALNLYTLDTAKKNFADLDLNARTRILNYLTTDAGWRHAAARRMVSLARNHVLALYYSSPAAYRMLGYTAPRFGYLQDVESAPDSGTRDG